MAKIQSLVELDNNNKIKGKLSYNVSHVSTKKWLLDHFIISAFRKKRKKGPLGCVVLREAHLSLVTPQAVT